MQRNDYAADGGKKNEQVPLLRPWKTMQAGQTVPVKNSWTVVFGFLKHTFLHALLFMVVSIIFMVGYHQLPKILTGITAFLVLALLSDALYIYYMRQKLSKECLAFAVCALAIFAGGVVGTSINLQKLNDYWPYYQKRHYTNVAPDEPAASHSDASVIVFMQGARPDPSRAMGYQRYGHHYCVAPIALEAGYTDDDSGAAASDIQYWAVGKDCCGSRKKGFSCDDSENSKARSGLVLIPKSGEESFVASAMSSDEMAYYEKAVLMTESKFDLTSPKERLYVRFVQDIGAARDLYWKEAWWSWGKWQAIWLVVWIVVGVMTIIVAAGDMEDDSKYNEHMVDAKQSVLYKLNHWI